MIYLKTSCPEVYTADCGEMVATSYVLGIPHPTGYAVYCQLNRFIAMSLPLSNIAHRSAILSAVCAAAAVLFFYLFLNIFFPVTASVFGALLLAFSFTFWSQANIQEVYTLHIFFLCALLMLAALLYRRFSVRILLCFAFVLGLALTHHLLTVFAVPALCMLAAGRDLRNWRFRGRHLTVAISAGILGMSTLMYFPFRSLDNCAIRWIVCHTWRGFKYHITGEQFRGMIFNVTLEEYISNFMNFITKLVGQASIIPVILAGIGGIVLILGRRRLGWFSAVFFGCVAAFFLGYRIIDIEVYYIQSYLPVFICAAAGFEWIRMQWLRRFRTAVIPVFLVCFFGCFLVFRSYWMNNRTDAWVAYDWGINIYNCLPADALLITQGWSSPFVFFYLDHVLAYRKDTAMEVDYKGVYFYRAAMENWETPVLSTVPMEIPGLEETPFSVAGVTYEFLPGGRNSSVTASLWPWMRTRGMFDPSIALDFHGLALKAKYVMMQGEWCFQSGRPDTGFGKLRESEAIAGFNPLILSNLSGVYFKQACYDDAERLARRAIDISPGFYPAYHNLGNALLKKGRFDEAIEAFEAVDDYNHALGRQREALGFAYVNRGMYEQALIEFERALDVSPFSVSAGIGSGIAKMHLGRSVGALGDFNRILEVHPGNREALINRSILYMQLGEYERAEQDLERLLILDPDHLEAGINRAVIMSETGRIGEALDTLERLRAEHPYNVTILNNLALVYALAGRDIDALEAWESSLDIDPSQVHIRRNLRRFRIDRRWFWSVDKP